MKFITTLLSIGFLFTLQGCANAQFYEEDKTILDKLKEKNINAEYL